MEYCYVVICLILIFDNFVKVRLLICYCFILFDVLIDSIKMVYDVVYWNNNLVVIIFILG